MKKILFILLLLNISCSSSQKKKDKIEGKCFIVEENFNNSPIRDLLKTTNYRRDLVDKFLNDDSPYAYLSIIGDNIVYASLKNNNFEIIHNSEPLRIKDATGILDELKYYCNLNTIYVLECPKDYMVFDSEDGFVYYWIKQAGMIKFICYNKKGSYDSLNDKDKRKLSALIKIDNLIRME